VKRKIKIKKNDVVIKKEKKTLSSEQERIIDIVMNEKESLFFTGFGGCGKTYILNVLIKRLLKVYGWNKIGMTSSTGLSAQNIIGGVTIHKFTQIGIMDKSVDEVVALIKKNDYHKKRLVNLEILIIDEISMISAETFDYIDSVLREIRKNKEPFGGVQLVLSGDFFQLRPVKGNYVWKSKNWKLAVKRYALLTKPYRQTNEYFINGLNKMRLGKIDKEFDEYIKGLSQEIKYDNDDEPTRLYATVDSVNLCNQNKLNKLYNETLVVYKAEDWSVAMKNDNKNRKPTHDDFIKHLDDATLAEKILKLKIGAKVMYIWNEKENKKLVNGSKGIIVGFRNGATIYRKNVPKEVSSKFLIPIVKFNGIDEEIEIKLKIFQKRNYEDPDYLRVLNFKAEKLKANEK
ncbi:1002_t:CDS:2, partial [Cetraspora pellucida]